MKYLIASLILLGFLMMGKVMGQAQCDPGYYDAGGFCKAEPTGCPYGDSLDADTCAKFEPQPTPVDTPSIIEEGVETNGK